MSASTNSVTYIGRTNHRNANILFGIKQLDRRSHMYICGKTGSGKSHLIRNLLIQDIKAGRGCALFDPHGDLVRDAMQLVPENRRADVHYLDATDENCPLRFNPFLNVRAADRALACAGLITSLKKLWPDDWGPSFPIDLLGIRFFGSSRGFVFGEIGIMLGAVVAFCIGRIVRDSSVSVGLRAGRLEFLVGRLMPFLENETEVVQLKRWFLIRLVTCPLFDSISYAAGLTRTRFRPFFVGTLLGNIPIMGVFYLVENKALGSGPVLFASLTICFLTGTWIAAHKSLDCSTDSLN